MSPETLALLERELARLHQEHTANLLSATNSALRLINLKRRATVSDSYESLLSHIGTELSEFQSKANAAVILVIEAINSEFTKADKSAVLLVAAKYFDQSTYLERFEGFAGVITRHFGRAGMEIDLSAFRLDLIEARLMAGTSHGINVFKASLADNLEVIVQRQEIAVARKEKKTESAVEQANRLIKIEPNVFGIGINLNYLIRRLLGRKE